MVEVSAQGLAARSSTCIFCDNTLGPKTKPEHILLNALGGRKSTRQATCSKCNEHFGSTIDQAIAAQAATIRNLFQMPSGDGKTPPRVRKVDSVQGTVDLNPDGSVDLKKKPFVIEDLGDGRSGVNVHANSIEHLHKLVPQIAAATKMSEEQIWQQFEGVQATRVIAPAPEISVSLHFGGEDAFRSITKSCLALLATVVGSNLLKGDSFRAAREFVLQGGKDFMDSSVREDARFLPDEILGHLTKVYGPHFSFIYVGTNDAGRTIGYFGLYNVVYWRVVLAEAGAIPNLEIALASDPTNPATWSDKVAKDESLSFEWFDSPDNQDVMGATNKRLDAAMATYFEKGRTKETGRAVDEVFNKYFKEGEVLQGERFTEMVRELSERVAHQVLKLPFEEPLTIKKPGPKKK